MENTGNFGCNGNFTERSNRNIEPEIADRWNWICLAYTAGIFAEQSVVSDAVFAGFLYQAEGVSGGCACGDWTDDGDCQQCSSGIPDYTVYGSGPSPGKVCSHTSDNVSDLVADCADSSGCSGRDCVLCGALEKSAGGPAEGESDGIGLCIGGFHAGDLGGFKFLHCDRRSGASFWKYRTGL